MMLKKILLKSGIMYGLLALSLFVLLGFVQNKQYNKLCPKIIIEIDNTYDNYFVSEADILEHINFSGTVIGKSLGDINLKSIEKHIESDLYVKDAQVFVDLKGNLVAKIKQNRPIARIMEPDGNGKYISFEKGILPLSQKFTSRVIIIDGAFASKIDSKYLQSDEKGKMLFELLLFIQADPFWKAQIAQITIDKHQELHFIPQIGKQSIEFGNAGDYQAKFRKLKVFYNKILPAKGWNEYSKVNLKYKGQLVCE